MSPRPLPFVMTGLAMSALLAAGCSHEEIRYIDRATSVGQLGAAESPCADHCEVDAECDDGDPCTLDTCGETGCVYTLVEGCPSDEFDDPSSLSSWSLLHEVEGRPAQHSAIEIDADGLSIVPGVSGWYMNGTAPFLFREVGGDFVMSTQLSVGGLADPAGLPTSIYNTAGLIVRDPDSQPGAQNWVLNDLGRLAANQVGTMAKSTQDSQTYLFIDDGTASGELRICRVGDIFRTYRRLTGETDFTLTATFARPDLPDTLQAGPMAMAWAGPADVRARFEYVRFGDVDGEGDCTAALGEPEPEPEPEPETDPLSALNDEFDAASLSDWTILTDYEDRPANHDLIDVDATTPGALTVDPVVSGASNSGWFQSDQGPLVFQEISGDFAAVLQVQVGTVADLGSIPTGDYNSAGFLVRDPASFDPGDPGDVSAESWLMFNVGNQAGFVATETKTTYPGAPTGAFQSSSSLFLTPVDAVAGRLAMCRIGDAFYFFHNLDGAGDTWTPQAYTTDNLFFNGAGLPLGDLASGFARPDFPETVQVGLMVNRWTEGPAGSSPVRAAFDYVRFWTPATPADCLPQ